MSFEFDFTKEHLGEIISADADDWYDALCELLPKYGISLYAYYKRATNSDDRPTSGKPLISAFKTNALFQTREMSSDEAKEAYIETVTQYFLYRK